MSSSPFALYYPHTQIRDENWLKAALLYWDGGIRRIVPAGYEPPDTQAVLAASADELVKNVSPVEYFGEVSEIFLRRLSTILSEASAAAGTTRGKYLDEDVDLLETDVFSRMMLGSFREMHWEKMAFSVRDQLLGLNLARRVGHSLIMNYVLVAIYMTILADVISKRSGLPIISDRQFYAAFGRRVAYGTMQSKPRESTDILEELVSLEIDFPSPDQLAGVSMSQILSFRRRRHDEMRRFRTAINETILKIVDANDALGGEALKYELRREIQDSVRDYRRLLSEANFTSVKGALSLTAPSAIKDAAAHTGTLAILGGVASGSVGLTVLGLAVSAASVTRDSFVKRRAAAETNNYQYLLEVKKLLR